MVEDAVASPAIEVRGLEKSFGERRALAGIDLGVSRGECLVVFGPNGAGKTTLTKVLAMLARPSAGRVRIDGVDIRERPAQIRRKIGLVSHNTFLYHDLTVGENLRFYGRMYAVPDLEKRLRDVVSWAQLDDRLDDRVGTLSRGLQQRASIARAVLHNPSVLLLDEPEVGLDPDAGNLVRDILRDEGSGGRTVVMTTHNLERGLELGDSFIILDRGKIVHRASGRGLRREDLRQIYHRCVGGGA